ncbi:MAG: EAL domain-containing protein [Actinomycetota bacterium]
MGAAASKLTSIDALLDVARRQLGMEVAFIAEFTGETRVLRHVSAGRPTRMAPGDSEPLEGTLCQLIVDGHLPQAMPDASANPVAAAVPITLDAHLGAYVGVPVTFRDGRIYGTLCSFQTVAEPTLSSRDASVLSVIAKAVSELLEDGRAQQDKREEMLDRITTLVVEGGPTIVYQPIVDTHSGMLAGAEALSRFPADSGLSTEAWYERAAEVEAEPELELSALRAAVGVLDDFDGYLSLNLSARTICTPAAQHFLADLPLDRIVLELTEHVHIPDYDSLHSALRPLRAAGMRLAVDDAGAGFASLQHILRLAADMIKLDRSLITALERDPARQALIRALKRFADDTGALVVAEGVETEDELAALRLLDIRYVQGYLLGRPVPFAQLRTPTRA